MNNGNYEHAMIQTTRVHTSAKMVLKWDDSRLDASIPGLDEEHFSFLRFLNDFDSLSDAVSAMSEGRWKYLFCIVRGKVTAATGVNFCIYENPHGLWFDVTLHSVEFKEVEQVHKDVKVETEAEQLQRLKDERVQIDLKIKNLQEKRVDVCDRIHELLEKIMGEELFFDTVGRKVHPPVKIERTA